MTSSSWPKVPLGDLCEVIAGGTPSRSVSRYWENGDVPWVKISDMLQGVIKSTDECITQEGLANSPAKLLPKGTLLLSIFATIGRTAVLDLDAATNQAIVGLRLRRADRLDLAFLRRFLDFKASTLASISRGVAQANINGAILKALEVPLPSIPEQRRIAAILDQAEALRTKRRAALAKLDTLAQSIFIEMFGDPDENPKGFPISELQNLCTKITDGTHQSPSWVSTGIPFLFISNIVNGLITFDTDKYISRETYVELTRRCPIENGDVLFTTVGSYGNAAVVNEEREFCFQRHIAHIKPNQAKLAPAFLAAMIESPGVRRQVDRAARGVAQKTVNLADLKALKVFAPPLEIQRVFTNKLTLIQMIKESHLKANAVQEGLFRSLQHHIFCGEL